MIGIDRLDFDCNLQVSSSIDSLVDLTEGSLIDFSDNLKVFANFFEHLGHGLVSNNIYKRKRRWVLKIKGEDGEGVRWETRVREKKYR